MGFLIEVLRFYRSLKCVLQFKCSFLE